MSEDKLFEHFLIEKNRRGSAQHEDLPIFLITSSNLRSLPFLRIQNNAHVFECRSPQAGIYQVNFLRRVDNSTSRLLVIFLSEMYAHLFRCFVYDSDKSSVKIYPKKNAARVSS